MSSVLTITSPPQLSELVAGGPIALFLDFDGTLVEIAPTPGSILVPSGLGKRLEDLSASLDGRMALVSGRSLADLDAHIGTTRIARAGSHGLECELADGTPLLASPAQFPSDALAELVGFAAAHENTLVEVKTHGAALHYRRAPGLGPQVLALAQDIAESTGLDLKRGKCVVELLPRGGGKGAAVKAFSGCRPFADAVPIFLGDDITDEDGFREAEKSEGFGIIVGNREGTLARYRLASVGEVHRWLGW